MKKLSLLAHVAAALLATLVSAAALAQTWPSRPVRIIVPFPPGGTNDILGRIAGERLQRVLGQPFVVENRGGAGGVIGADVVAKSAPDGYTLLLASSAPLAVGLSLFKKVPYDVMKDFAPVSMVADVTVTFVTFPGFKPQSVKEVVAHAQANPGQVRAALPALGSMHHLLTELFRLQTNTKLNMIPYKGTGPAVADLMAGVVDIDFENLPAVIGHIRGQKLRALAVASAERSELLPEVPTMKELGYPELVAAPWFALVAPAGTPREVVTRLNETMNAWLREPETKALLAKQGANPMIYTPEQTASLIRQEIDKWAKVVKESGAKLE
jgi:tripartite-type tricarboxylate transporter receptor subunit TctC